MKFLTERSEPSGYRPRVWERCLSLPSLTMWHWVQTTPFPYDSASSGVNRGNNTPTSEDCYEYRSSCTNSTWHSSGHPGPLLSYYYMLGPVPRARDIARDKTDEAPPSHTRVKEREGTCNSVNRHLSATKKMKQDWQRMRSLTMRTVRAPW